MNKLSFEDRIKKIISVAGSADKLAYNAGVSPSLIGKYLSGKTDPTRKKLIALAEAACVNIEWLATGEGPMRAGERERFDIELLSLIIESLDDYQASEEVNFTADEKADIINYTYELCYDADLNVAASQTKSLIMNTIKEAENLFSSLDKLLKTEKGKKQAVKIFKKAFGHLLSADEAESQADEFVGAQLLRQHKKISNAKNK
ncbi:MAG: helix-turn-helix transcriptional regulator [Smithellaceae bacterium]|jgi:transcriptional regulator with XRE-family HTH domain|nr:helix-turn-helix transcriptional regulator [Smithellaceae bacterium]HQQ88172.1 helix-turn-helix transcriptional regulator [Smithellaceae bacterium]